MHVPIGGMMYIDAQKYAKAALETFNEFLLKKYGCSFDGDITITLTPADRLVVHGSYYGHTACGLPKRNVLPVTENELAYWKALNTLVNTNID